MALTDKKGLQAKNSNVAEDLEAHDDEVEGVIPFEGEEEENAFQDDACADF